MFVSVYLVSSIFNFSLEKYVPFSQVCHIISARVIPRDRTFDLGARRKYDNLVCKPCLTLNIGYRHPCECRRQVPVYLIVGFCLYHLPIPTDFCKVIKKEKSLSIHHLVMSLGGVELGQRSQDWNKSGSLSLLSQKNNGDVVQDVELRKITDVL